MLTSGTWFSSTKQLFRPLFLTGFFFSAGYLYVPKLSFCEMVKHKAKTLLIPWFFFCIIYIIPFRRIGNVNILPSVLENAKWALLQIRHKNDWCGFLVCIFVSFFPLFFFVRLYEKYKTSRQYSWTILSISFFLALLSRIFVECANPNCFPWGTTTLPWHLEYMF